MPRPTSDQARWPARVGELCALLRGSSQEQGRRLRGELWVLVHGAISRYLERQASPDRVPREDLRDIASTKALEVLASIDSGSWDPVTRSGPEIAGFLASVARNGVVDFRRRLRLTVPWNDEERGAARVPSRAESPAWRVEARQFAEALHDCLEELPDRSRRIWIYRVFYDLPSKRIAAHPRVSLKPSHVDVLLQRCREAIRRCMSAKGHETDRMPPGTFARLWAWFERSPGAAGAAAPVGPPEPEPS